MPAAQVDPGQRRVAVYACFPGKQLRAHVIGAGRDRRLRRGIRRDEQPQVTLGLRGLGPHLECGREQQHNRTGMGLHTGGVTAKAAA